MPRITLTLNNRPYALECEPQEEARLRELAAYVDTRMQEIGTGTSQATDSHVLAIVCLKLADELLRLKGDGADPASEEQTLIAAVQHLTERVESIARQVQAA